MLHVRVVSPPGATEDLIGRLAADPGIRNLLVLPGAARHPDGDAVQFDLLDQFANWVLHELRAQIGDGSSIVIENVDASIAATGASAEPRNANVPPVWDLVEAKIRAGGEYPPSLFALLVIAGLIGAVGILTSGLAEQDGAGRRECAPALSACLANQVAALTTAGLKALAPWSSW
jgi:hypothetical protein